MKEMLNADQLEKATGIHRRRVNDYLRGTHGPPLLTLRKIINMYASRSSVASFIVNTFADAYERKHPPPEEDPK